MLGYVWATTWDISIQIEMNYWEIAVWSQNDRSMIPSYCDVPGSPCLAKIVMSQCLVAARSPGWFVGDPTSLAQDNIYNQD